MKQVLFLFVSLIFYSCSNNPIPKPDRLLDEDVMVNLIFDIAILQATDGAMPSKLNENNIVMDKYVFEKYKIDSITYIQNQRYYAADVKKYKKIYKKVIERLDSETKKITADKSDKIDKDGKIIYEPIK